MTNFLKSLLKQFHPDNKETGDKEKFIKVKDKIEELFERAKKHE